MTTTFTADAEEYVPPLTGDRRPVFHHIPASLMPGPTKRWRRGSAQGRRTPTSSSIQEGLTVHVQRRTSIDVGGFRSSGLSQFDDVPTPTSPKDGLVLVQGRRSASFDSERCRSVGSLYVDDVPTPSACGSESWFRLGTEGDWTRVTDMSNSVGRRSRPASRAGPLSAASTPGSTLKSRYDATGELSSASAQVCVATGRPLSRPVTPNFYGTWLESPGNPRLARTGDCSTYGKPSASVNSGCSAASYNVVCQKVDFTHDGECTACLLREIEKTRECRLQAQTLMRPPPRHVWRV